MKLKLSFSFLSLPLVVIQGNPTCSPPIDSFWPPEAAAVQWQICGEPSESNAIYGVTTEKFEYFEAFNYCRSINAELVSIEDVSKDQCVFHALKEKGVFGEEVMFSARYLDGFNNWAWCSKYDCSPVTWTDTVYPDRTYGYNNWEETFWTEGNCMSGYVQETASPTFSENYRWMKRDCSQKVRAVCRIDCDEINPPVEPVVQQKLYYSVATGDKTNFFSIYEYDVDEEPKLIAKHDAPFQSSTPSLVFNYQLNVLEVVGDFFVTSNGHHYQMNNEGKFQQIYDTMYEADAFGSIVYTPNVGTIVIGGQNKGQKTYIITPNVNWNVDENDKWLSNIQGEASKNFGVTTNEDKIYLLGGFGGPRSINYHYIQMIDYTGVSTLSEAKSKNWVNIGYLKSGMSMMTAQFVNNQIYVAGYCTVNGQNVQKYDIATGQTSAYSWVINYGKSHGGLQWPASYVSNDESGWTVIGGFKNDDTCIIQGTSFEMISSWWGGSCMDSQDAVFDDLLRAQGGPDQMYGAHVKYANYFDSLANKNVNN